MTTTTITTVATTTLPTTITTTTPTTTLSYTPYDVYTYSNIGDDNTLLLALNYTNNNTEYKDNEYYTPLHKASRNGHLKCIQLLLDRHADIDGDDDDACSPLHCAIEGNHTECLSLLCQYGANTEARVKVNNDTPLHVAAKMSDIECARILLHHNANVNSEDRYNQTPLMAVCQVRRGSNSNDECFQLLLDKGADVNNVSISGLSALDFAVRNSDSIKYATMLLDRGADVNCKVQKSLTTTLQVAASKYSKDTLELLLSRGANINVKDNDNNSLLFQAVIKGNSLPCMLLLLDKGIDINNKNINNTTILQAAICNTRHDCSESINELLLRGADLTKTFVDSLEHDNVYKSMLMNELKQRGSRKERLVFDALVNHHISYIPWKCLFLSTCFPYGHHMIKPINGWEHASSLCHIYYHREICYLITIHVTSVLASSFPAIDPFMKVVFKGSSHSAQRNYQGRNSDKAQLILSLLVPLLLEYL